jgi:hypothetical protein
MPRRVRVVVREFDNGLAGCRFQPNRFPGIVEIARILSGDGNVAAVAECKRFCPENSPTTLDRPRKGQGKRPSGAPSSQD